MRFMNLMIYFLALMLSVFFCDIGDAEIGSSSVTHAEVEVEALDGYIQQFYKDTGRYPTMAEGMEALRTKPVNTPKWAGPYLKKLVPIDPWGNKYIYLYPAKYGSKSYDVYSFGINGQDDQGLRDDIANWRPVDRSYYEASNNYGIIFLLSIAIIISITIFLRLKILSKNKAKQ